MADPVSGFSRISTRISERICALSADSRDRIGSVIIHPDSADSAIKARPLVVVHDLLRINRTELYMGDPALRNLLLIEQFSALRIIDAEITAQILLLNTTIDVIDRAFVKSGSLGLRVKIQASSISHRHTEAFSIETDMGECRHASVWNAVELLAIAETICLADFVILNVIDDLFLIIKADTRLSKTLVEGSVEIHIAF